MATMTHPAPPVPVPAQAPPASNGRRALPWLALVAAMALFGSSFAGLKIAFIHYDPMFVLFGRMLVASVVFAALSPRMGLRDVRRSDLKWMLLMTVCEPGIYFLCESRAIQLTTSGQAGVVLGLLPVCVGLAAALVLRERLTPAFLMGCGLALVGVLLLSLRAEASEAAPNPMLGNFYEFLAVLCAAVYTVLTKALVARYKPLFVASLQAFGGVLFFMPFLLREGAMPAHFSTEGVAAIVYLGLAVTLLAYFLYVFAIQSIPAGRAAMATNLIPVFAVVLGWALLGETLRPGQIAAVPVVLAGIILSQKGSRHTPDVAAP